MMSVKQWVTRTNAKGIVAKAGRYGGTQQTSVIYASEADVLNMALFGITAKQWKEQNPNKKGNIRDFASINELICLSNLENINSVLIKEGLDQASRIVKLNEIAISQMSILYNKSKKYLNKIF